MGLISFKNPESRRAFTIDTSDVTFMQLYNNNQAGVLEIYLRHMQQCISVDFSSLEMAEEVYDAIVERMQEDEDAFADVFDAGEEEDD